MTDAAQSALGRQGRRQLDWFADSRDTLKPLLVERNACHRSWITNGRRNDDYQKLRTARRQARQAVRTAKNQWFATVAGRVESGRFNSARVWAGIRSLEDARSGLKPIPNMAILDENGNICTSPAEQGQRWSRHFTKVYNIPSTFDSGVIDQVEQQDIVEELGEPPNLAELQRAVSAMSNGKVAGGSDILPEMVKAGGPALMCALLDLVCTVWEAKAVPQEWVCSNLVPIPKKGNLAKCDNWRGIALLEVVGKVVAAMIQRRLQSLAETILPDYQCGSRKGWSCTDMVFAVRQVAEKLYEHRCKGFLVFVDLRKAYDSVSRQCLWIILKKAGVPERLINIIRSFRTNMTTTLKIPGVDAPPIEVQNGLRQGCCMAPVLFNLLMWAVLQQWHRAVADIPGIGIPVATNPGGSLLFSRKSTDKSKVHRECRFADDSALLATTHDGAQLALDQFIHVAYFFGLTVNLDKTKVMAAGYGLVEAAGRVCR